MKSLILALASLVAIYSVNCDVYFEEKFPDDSWESNWIYSEHPGKEFGKFKLTAGKFYNDPEEDKGLQTSEDARFYALSRKFEPFSNDGKNLVVQFSVKHEQDIDCGGGYLKVFDCKLDQKDMHGESPYEIMFGPDICGPGTKKVHVIFSYKGKNHLIKKDIRCKDDVYTHLYTLIVKPDNTYEVLIDNEVVEKGELEADWDFLPPKKIKDPEAKKPEDWDDRKTIPDPEDTKPEDWEKPEHIPDPDATKPEDWDDEMDGEWEPPMIDNPDYKGVWAPKQIDNPAYKGQWIHPEIDNPEYVADANLYKRPEICAVGLDLWQVKSGTIFDNFLITDDPEAAKERGEALKKTLEGEKKMKNEQDEAGDAPADKSQIETTDANDSTITIDENDDDDDGKPEPTHYSKIDLRTIKVDQLRQELRARNVSCKGLRAQLVSRLSKLVKAEEEKESKSDDVMEVEDDEPEEKKETEEEHIEIKDDKTDEPIIEEEAPVVIPDENEEKNDKKDKEDVDKNKPKEDKKDNKEKSEEKKEKPKTEKEIEEEKKKIEKEKQVLKTKYEMPSTPHIIVHPSTSAKGGKFSCNVATLSLLLDYRITDNKEHSFELFVFAELFNEMLMRDFGFYVYKTLYTLPEKAEEVKEKDKSVEKSEKKEEKKTEPEKKEEKRDDKEKKDDKRDLRKRDRRESHSDDERSGSPRRRSRGVELPPDPYLLLSLVYFDTARGGLITRKDLQNLFMSLGLQLSRSQIRSILEKVCIRDNFSYKSLIQAIKDLAAGTPEAIQDLPLDSTVANNEVPAHITELEATIASGNRELLPVFNKDSNENQMTSSTKDISDSGIVTYKSRVVDVGALVAGAGRWAGERARLEAALAEAGVALRAARAAAACTQRAERGAQVQLNDVCAALAAARARIASLTASSKIFHSALKSIQSKVEAVVNIKYEDDDVVEVVNGPSKTEKDDKDKSEEKALEKSSETENKDTEANSDNKEEKQKDSKESDIIGTENMDLDDK